jgi:hypothetical protein
MCQAERAVARLGSRLLAEVSEFARARGMDFVILFADDGRLYARNGWAAVPNRCSWLKIHEHTTLGLAPAADTGVMMVKAVGERAWPDGDVDMLGHLSDLGQCPPAYAGRQAGGEAAPGSVGRVPEE